MLCSVQEIENLNRSHKQAAAVHGTVEVRLNRALEEVERSKTQLNKMKQMNKVLINTLSNYSNVIFIYYKLQIFMCRSEANYSF